MKFRQALIDSTSTVTTCESLVDWKHGIPWGIWDELNQQWIVAGPTAVKDLVLYYCENSIPAVPPGDEDVLCTQNHDPVP
jgi:hypothetical protein